MEIKNIEKNLGTVKVDVSDKVAIVIESKTQKSPGPGTDFVVEAHHKNGDVETLREEKRASISDVYFLSVLEEISEAKEVDDLK